jgi:hypothetical protein
MLFRQLPIRQADGYPNHDPRHPLQLVEVMVTI